MNKADWELSHLWGPGFGDEAAAGLMIAPREMNQLFQNRGAEGYIRDLYEAAKAEGGTVRVRATATAWELPTPSGWKPSGLQGEFLKDVRYEVSVTLPNGRVRRYDISIETMPPPNPRVLKATAVEIVPK